MTSFRLEDKVNVLRSQQPLPSVDLKLGFTSPPKKNHRPSYKRDGNRGPLKGIDEQPLRLSVVSRVLDGVTGSDCKAEVDLDLQNPSALVYFSSMGHPTVTLTYLK